MIRIFLKFIPPGQNLYKHFFFNKNMRKLYLALFLIIIISFLSPTLLADSEEITFIALGHVYPDYDALNLSLDLIEQENPDFVVFLGDSLQAPDESWDELKPIIDKISVPVYFAPGNHDIPRDNPLESIFIKEISSELFFSFKVGEINFLVLNTVPEKEAVQDISEEQVEFTKAIINSEDKNIIFMHHCLFYNYDNQFCNSRLFIDENNWNKLAPTIQNKTLAVFVGDVGVKESYFGYEENGISYFGIGFSPKESQLKIPQHMLKVTLNGTDMKVTPIPIRQDLTKVKYLSKETGGFLVKFKAFIKKNLELVLKTFSMIVTFLFLVTVFLSYKLFKKNHKVRRSIP